MLSTSRLVAHYKYDNDWSTPINYSLHNKGKGKTLVHMKTYAPFELGGFYTHGIKTKLQVLMNIIKNGAILSQNEITRKGISISQHTGYYGSEKNRISFSMFGDGKISELYGKGGITLISNIIEPFRDLSHMPYEWFCDHKVPIDDIVIAIDKEFAHTHIANLNSKEIFHWDDRKNNYHLMLQIIKFLHCESGIPIMRCLYDTQFRGVDSVSSTSSSSLDDDDDDDLDEVSFEEFDMYYVVVLEHIIENNGNLFPNTVLNLVQALLTKYKLNDVKIILVDYEKEDLD